MATHSTVLAWRIPGTGEPGGLPSMGSHRVRHDWSDLAAAAEMFPAKGHNWDPHTQFSDTGTRTLLQWIMVSSLWFKRKTNMTFSEEHHNLVHSNPTIFFQRRDCQCNCSLPYTQILYAAFNRAFSWTLEHDELLPSNRVRQGACRTGLPPWEISWANLAAFNGLAKSHTFSSPQVKNIPHSWIGKTVGNQKAWF